MQADSLPAEPRGKTLGSFKVRTRGPPATKLVPSPSSSEESEVDSDPEQGRAALLLSPATGRERELPAEGRPEIPGDAQRNWRSWSPEGSLAFYRGNGYIKLPHSEALGISRYPEGRSVGECPRPIS